MRVVQINLTARQGGTGRVCYGISKALSENNIENYTLFASNEEQGKFEIKYGSDFKRKINALISKIFGNHGFNSHIMTKKLISHLEKLKPDIVQLHNLHGHNVNIKMIFSYFKKNPQIKLFWTFHDFWAFTGYCPYFELVECEKWENGCGNCPLKNQHSWFFDKSKKLYRKKKELFTGLNLTIVAPSDYIANKTKQSFLKDYEIKVIHNGIDLNVFKPTNGDFREKYNLENKYIVLGVADVWGKRKGLDTFIKLASRLPKEYQIVLVGTNDKIDKLLPKNIISIHRIQNVAKLTEIYTASDVFVNPTLDEAFGMVNIEALACGTPVITYNSGGSPECIDESCGIVVEKNHIDTLEKSIKDICEAKTITKNACVEYAMRFVDNETYRKYLNLYGDIK